jgi:hypothetical protein
MRESRNVAVVNLKWLHIIFYDKKRDRYRNQIYENVMYVIVKV